MSNLRDYQRFVIPKDYINKTKEELCTETAFRLQRHQAFLREYINNNLDKERFLIFHEKGSGKTCTAISVAEKFPGKIIVISPAGLIQNFIAELKGPCGNRSVDNISEKYIFLSYPNFHKLVQRRYLATTHDKRDLLYFDPNNQLWYYRHSQNMTEKIAKQFVEEYKGNQLGRCLVVVDESHNLTYSPVGEPQYKQQLKGGPPKRKKLSRHAYFNSLLQFIQQTKGNCTFLLMTATPIFDNAFELGPLLKVLVYPHSENITIKSINDTYIDKDSKSLVPDIARRQQLKEELRGYISYFSGGHPNAYPIFNVRYQACLMKPGGHQEQAYLKLLNKRTSIHFGVAYRKLTSWSFTEKKVPKALLERDSLEQYSCKFYTLLNSLLTQPGSFFVYSNFKKFSVSIFSKVLIANGFARVLSNATADGVFETKTKRFALITGDTDKEVRQRIIEMYNDPRNYRGEYIKALLGSAALKEGITLKNVRAVYILEPHWNNKRTSQVLGRAIRYCSHIQNPNPVDVRILVAITEQQFLDKAIETIDQQLVIISDQKELSVSTIERLIKNAAFDCQINYHSHFVRKGEKLYREPLECLQTEFSPEELNAIETQPDLDDKTGEPIEEAPTGPRIMHEIIIDYLKQKYLLK